MSITPNSTAASFSNSPPLITACGSQTATLLSNGKVLIAGGRSNAGLTGSVAEQYDPFSGTWDLTNSMNADRANHTATLLPNGKVLVAGGYSSTNGALAVAELFDPITGTWTNTGPMNVARFLHTATLLPNGQVLVAGGTSNGTSAVTDAEVYNPPTGTWTAANSPNFARYSHTATLLPNGQVLVAGGISAAGTLVATAELYDSSTGIWTATNSVTTPRYSHTATLLPEGEVLIAGGATTNNTAISGAELYDPGTGSWTAISSLNTARFDHSATLLPNGTVLVAGGTSNGTAALTNAEVYSPGTGAWTVVGSLDSGRYSQTATLLPSEDVLVVGGFDTNQALSSVERYNSATGAWSSTGSMIVTQTGATEILLANGTVLVVDPGGTTAEIYNTAIRAWKATAGMSAYRNGYSFALLPNGNVLAAGGYDSQGTSLATAELFVPTIGAWTATGSMNQPQAYATATLLADGKLLIAGGVGALGNFSSSAELYDPSTGTWTVTGSLNTARAYHIATALPNGNVLVAGGESETNYSLTSSELYDADSGTWSYTGELNASRTAGFGVGGSTATLLPSGEVLAAGGYDYDIAGNGTLSSAELYDPITGTWTLTAPIPQPRYAHTATLLPNGKVLVAGGNNGTNNLSSALLYDPAAGSWAVTASLSAALAYHAASLLPNGNVLVTGGYGANFVPVSNSELYNPDSGINAAWRPVISSVSLLNTNSGVTVSGSGFRGVSEGSSGNTQDSPGDYPVTELISLCTGQTLFLPATNWSTNSISCAPASGLPPGYLLATIFVNGIPSPGQIFKIPSLPVVSNLPATLIQAAQATLNAEVLDTGGDNPSITLYYGTTDGGTNAGAWSNSIPLGFQGGVFKQTVSGLLSNITYYFTVSAVNVIGTSWAVPSQSFTTVTTPVVTNLPVTGIQALAATLNGQVLFTGNDTPSVTIYYGPTNGGANAAAWSNSVAMGLQSGPFAQMVTGLTQDTTYFYTAQAVNLAGTNWAAPPQSFTTLAITPPVVTNLPATSVQGTFATLNGLVLSVGNQTPSVTLYYGPANGGTNAGSWAQSVAIGLEGGAFAQTVSGLSTNTTYFYAAQAVNSAGPAWALPPQSFTTAATNSVLPPAVLTQHYDDGRTGMNLNEFLLNTATVNPTSFGLLYTRPVDDQLYAQPLIATNVTITNRGAHDLLILCTVNDTVYAYDANDSTVTVPYWKTTFINPPAVVPPQNSDLSAVGACGGSYHDFSGKIGIVGTPVIDPVSGTIYLIARTKESGNFVQRLHALDITTGADRTNSPVVIAATDQFGDVFDPLRQNQRAGLALANGVVYVCWTSHCDLTPYSGWVMGYDAATLQQLYVFNDCPGLNQAGIWMSGQAPAIDSNGNLYLSTGNGYFDGVQSFGESFLKLTPSAGELQISSYFTPYNWSDLNGGDYDLGSAGVLLIPNTALLLSGGKAGTLYLVNKDNMGGNSATAAQEATNILQSWSLGGEVHGGPVWWDGPNGSYAYVWGASGLRLKQYQLLSTAGRSNFVQITNATTFGGSGQPGGVLSVSANKSTPGSGIVWAAVNTSQDANQAVVAGTLHAYDAGNVGYELWNSGMNPARDAIGSLAKFVPPVVAGGKVYIATFSERLDVYGLFPSAQNLNALALENQPLTILPAQLLSLASDPYGFSLTVSSVSPASTNGGTVVLGSNSIVYTPLTGFIGMDRFTYTVASSQGGAISAFVFVQVVATNQPSSAMLPLTLAPGGASISFSGISGQNYTVQRALTLAGPWTPLTNVIIGPYGASTFVDTNPPAPAAFYRTSFP